MGRSIQIVLPSGKRWSKKGDAIEHFKAILHQYRIGDRVDNPNDHADLLGLLQLYDSVIPAGEQTKTGCGVAHFEKRLDQDHPGNTACFFVVRTDGTSIDFSTRRALDVAGTL